MANSRSEWLPIKRSNYIDKFIGAVYLPGRSSPSTKAVVVLTYYVIPLYSLLGKTSAVENPISRHGRRLPLTCVADKCSGSHIFCNTILRESYVPLHICIRFFDIQPWILPKFRTSTGTYVSEGLCTGFEFHLFGVRDRSEWGSGYQSHEDSL